jgi:hypothetical protein
MNPKIATLLTEGFSINTLENFSSEQINVLYERVKKSKKETKEATTVTTTKTIYSPQEAKGKSFQGTTNVKSDGSVEVTKEGEVTEKAVSKKQQEFFGIVRGMQKGDIPKKGKAGKAAKEMKKKDVKDFASTKHKNLPNKKTETKESDDVKKLEESIMRLVEKHISNQFTKTDILKMINKR